MSFLDSFIFSFENIFVLVFLSGLLGGVGHCIGMCGPVVTAYSMQLQKPGWLPHLFYNLGRILTYGMMGAILGFMGAFIVVEPLQGFQTSVMVGCGAIIIILGVILAFRLPLMRYIEGRWGCQLLAKVMPIFRGQFTTGTMFPLGLILGFIPCGLVYTALISASRVGMEANNPVLGTFYGWLIMILFGLGTIPALFLYGKIVNLISVRYKDFLYRFSAVIMILCGILFIVQALW